MNVPTRAHPPSAPVFSERDLRDPALLGWALLVRARERANEPLSYVYDRDAHLLARIPEWTGDGLMSNDPELHHSKTPQTPAPGGQK